MPFQTAQDGSDSSGAVSGAKSILEWADLDSEIMQPVDSTILLETQLGLADRQQ